MAIQKIYVGNLPFTTTEEEIRDLFEQHGPVHSAKLVVDRETKRSRGFGFVEMEQDKATKAINALNGVEFGGRTLRVNAARERPPRRPRNNNDDNNNPS